MPKPSSLSAFSSAIIAPALILASSTAIAQDTPELAEFITTEDVVAVPLGIPGQAYSPRYCMSTYEILEHISTNYGETTAGEAHRLTQNGEGFITAYNPANEDGYATATAIITLGGNGNIGCVVGTASIAPEQFPEGEAKITDPTLFTFKMTPFSGMCRKKDVETPTLESIGEATLGDGSFGVELLFQNEPSEETRLHGVIELHDGIHDFSCMAGFLATPSEEENDMPDSEADEQHTRYTGPEYEI